jgi:SAM-dependent methyltransferase
MQNLPDIKQSESWDEENKLIENYIKSKVVPGIPLRILEAGCGRKWPLNLEGVQYVLTGVDLDKNALEIRKNVKCDLHEAIEGDLRSVNLGENTFDVIYNSFVLEHIKEADIVLENFSKWLRSGGLLIVRIPDPHSVRGFLTRATPHGFHMFYYRYILRSPNAGKPGYGPYVTFYHPVVSRKGIYEFCKKHHFVVKEEYKDSYYNYGGGLTGLLTKVFIRGVAMLSLGKLIARHTYLFYILEKDQDDRDRNAASAILS